MKSSIFWDTTPYNPLKVNGLFGGTCRLHLHDETSSASYVIHDSFLLVLFFGPEDVGDIFLRNVGRLSTEYTPLLPRKQNS
jgi:hypothetical protein